MSYEHVIQAVSVRYADLINRACLDLFHCLNLNHFWYCRIDNEGNYSFLGSHVGWCELFASEKLYQKYSYLRHPKFQQSGIHFVKNPQDPALFEVLSLCKNRFHMECLLSVITKDENGMEEFGFAAKSASDEQVSLLINELPLLRLFVKNFWEENPRLKTAFEDHQVNIGKLIGQSFYEPFAPVALQTKPLLLQKMKMEPNLSLTPSDIEVLRLMQEGLSAGQISTQIFRSPRTIEHRIERIKEKLCCFSKAELIKKARELEKFGFL